MKIKSCTKLLAVIMAAVTTIILVACEETPADIEYQSQTEQSVADSTATDSHGYGLVSVTDNTSATSEESSSSYNGEGNSTEKPSSIALIKEYFTAVVNSTDQSPFDYIPLTMQPDYSPNIVNAESVQYDFNTFVDVGSIKYGGFGEQWNMVIDNIIQSQQFYNYLGIGESVFATSVTIMDSFLNNTNEEFSGHEEETDSFKAELNYGNNILHYVVSFKTELELSLFGKVKPVVDMTFNVNTNVKSVLVSLTETNAMRYSISDNMYEFGIEYGVNSANRSAYCQIIKESNGNVNGHIYEYITVKDKDAVKSCADFYINDKYVSVVGNKASGMIGFTGYINELYDVNYGKLLGYEVQETLSILGVSGTYNTLWFNLSDISGISNIKIAEKSEANNSSRSTVDVYLNGSSTLFAPTYNKKVGIKTSRKYDIELRLQYFYGRNNEGNIVEYKTEIPMMFIQQDNDKDTNYSDYHNDMLADNGINSSVTLSNVYLDKIMSDYATLIDIFKSNKELVDSVKIKAYIGA